MGFFKKKLAEKAEPVYVKDPVIPLYAEVPANERLKRIIDFVNQFGFDDCFCDERGMLPVFSFIRMLSERLYSERVLEVISKNGISYDGTDFLLEYLLMHVCEGDPNYCKSVPGTADIVLAHHPIISNPWNAERLRDAINIYGTANNPWEFDRANHRAKLYLPFGLTIVNNGNHSLSAGILKETGVLHIPNRDIFDLSPMYDHYVFDGENYLDRYNNIVQKANSFEFGVIFELGRIIRNKKVRFLGIDYLDN